jgi:hypothetical protein
MTSDEKLTRTERKDLSELVKMQMRVAKAEVDARKAELLAEFEEQLATEFEARDERWEEFFLEGKQAVERANAEIQKAMARSGIPEKFRGGLGVSWYPRGENLDPRRRMELRRVGQTKIDAHAKLAKAQIEAAGVQALTELAVEGLTSNAAQAWIQRLPTAVELLPHTTLKLAEIEAEKPDDGRFFRS